MKKNFTTTLVLGGVLIALLAWYDLYEKKIKVEHTEKEENTKKLISLERDQIQELEIKRLKNAKDANANAPTPLTNPEFETIKLKKAGQDWMIVSPIQDMADQSTVSSLLNTLTSTKQERVVEEKPKDLEPFGLKYPILEVIARKDATTPQQEVLVGNNTPVGFSAYAKSTGSESIYKVSRSLRTGFDKDVFGLRNKNIFSIPRADVGEMEIQAGKENIVLAKSEKENWLLARENLPADTEETNKTLTPILELKATGFAAEKADDLTAFGLNNPVSKVQLTSTKDKTKITLRLGMAKNKVYAKRDDKPAVFEVDKSIVEKVTKPAAKYRSLQLANFNRFDLKHVVLKRGSEEIHLVKNDSGWTFPSEPQTKVDTAQVDLFLTKLQDTKAVRYGTATDKVKDPRFTIHLFEGKDAGEVEKVVLSFGKSSGKEVVAERKGLPLPLFIKEDDFNKIYITKASLIHVEPKASPVDVTKKEPPGKKS